MNEFENNEQKGMTPVLRIYLQDAIRATWPSFSGGAVRQLADDQLLEKWYESATLGALESRVRRLAQSLDYQLKKINTRFWRFDCPPHYRLFDEIGEKWITFEEGVKLHKALEILLRDQASERAEAEESQVVAPAQETVTDAATSNYKLHDDTIIGTVTITFTADGAYTLNGTSLHSKGFRFSRDTLEKNVVKAIESVRADYIHWQKTQEQLAMLAKAGAV